MDPEFLAIANDIDINILVLAFCGTGTCLLEGYNCWSEGMLKLSFSICWQMVFEGFYQLSPPPAEPEWCDHSTPPLTLGSVILVIGIILEVEGHIVSFFFFFKLETGSLGMLPRQDLNFWAQAIFPPQPPEWEGLWGHSICHHTWLSWLRILRFLFICVWPFGPLLVWSACVSLVFCPFLYWIICSFIDL